MCIDAVQNGGYQDIARVGRGKGRIWEGCQAGWTATEAAIHLILIRDDDLADEIKNDAKEFCNSYTIKKKLNVISSVKLDLYVTFTLQGIVPRSKTVEYVKFLKTA